MEIIYFIAGSFVFYTYVGYPVILAILNIFLRNKITHGSQIPYISLIIAAYNEEKTIRLKLDNSLALNYPTDKLEIIVASDNSSDNTDSIVNDFDSGQVLLVRSAKRKGKTGMQNLAINEAKGDIVIFSDATAMYKEDSLRKIIRKFADLNVGGVEGRLIYLPAESGFDGDKQLIKSYESLVKIMESNIWSGVGDNGTFYAVRKELFRPLREDLTSDFATPLDIVRQHKRFVFDPEAVSFDMVTSSSAIEFKRKVRTVKAGLNVFFNSLDLLNPIQHGWACFVLISRKCLRWASPLMLMILLITNLFLLHVFIYKVVFIFQVGFYTLAISGFIFNGTNKLYKIISVPNNFVLINVAALGGLFRFLMKSSSEIWTPQR